MCLFHASQIKNRDIENTTQSMVRRVSFTVKGSVGRASPTWSVGARAVSWREAIAAAASARGLHPLRTKDGSARFARLSGSCLPQPHGFEVHAARIQNTWARSGKHFPAKGSAGNDIP